MILRNHKDQTGHFMAVSHIQPMGGPSPASGRSRALREDGKAFMHGCGGGGVIMIGGRGAVQL